jgi:hypothetical protein
MFSSHVKGSSVERTRRTSPEDPARESTVTRADRKAAREAAEASTKAARVAERETEQATRRAADEALKADRAAQKAAEKAERKAPKPKEPPKPKPPLTARAPVKTPAHLDPFDPSYDPFAPPPKPGVNLALSALVLGAVAFLLAFVPIVKYLGAVFAACGLAVAALEMRRSLDQGRKFPRAAFWGRFLAIVALILVVLTTLMGFKASADNRKKGSGSATGMVLSQDLSVTFGAFSHTQNAVGQWENGLPIVVKNKSDGKRSFEFQVEALNKAGERIASEQQLHISMRSGEKRDSVLFTNVDDATAQSLMTARFRITNARS